MYVSIAERRGLMKCKTCGKTEKEAKFSQTRASNGKLYYRRHCNVCEWQLTKNGRRRREYTIPDIRPTQKKYTTKEEREADGWKCLCVDALVVAVDDHKEGKVEPEFWTSWVFELMCAQADCNPDYIRRGLSIGKVPTQEGMICSGP